MSNENIYNTDVIIDDSKFGLEKELFDRERNELCTLFIMRRIQKVLAANGLQVDFYDLEFFDGYFIFYRGSSKVAQFKIKQAPGWLFGIWWDDNISEDYNNGELFAQYEENIDKFKPSRSAFCVSCIGPTKQIPNAEETDYTDMVKFIIKEPYLAFYRDYNGVDYNRKYITRKEAKKVYIKWRNEAAQEKKNKDKLNHKVYSLLRRHIKDFKLQDNGEYCYPRYTVYIPNTKGTIKRGYVADLLPPKVAKKYEQLNERGMNDLEISRWYYIISCDEYENLTDTKL